MRLIMDDADGNIPPLGRRVFLAFAHELPFTRLRALHKGAVLFVKFAQDTRNLAFVYHALALSSPARVTRPIFSSACVG